MSKVGHWQASQTIPLVSIMFHTCLQKKQKRSFTRLSVRIKVTRIPFSHYPLPCYILHQSVTSIDCDSVLHCALVLYTLCIPCTSIPLHYLSLTIHIVTTGHSTHPCMRITAETPRVKFDHGVIQQTPKKDGRYVIWMSAQVGKSCLFVTHVFRLLSVCLTFWNALKLSLYIKYVYPGLPAKSNQFYSVYSYFSRFFS